ncbi:hypothetical protein VTO73DRAFT_12756 [Trametes versicolor]
MASPRLFFSPNTPCYAVIRMDPVAMVRKLDDTEAMDAARVMTPQSYVVFLSMELALPFPKKPWYRYAVNVIAPSLREEDAAKRITVDMCTPIYPNTQHPTGREPLRPDKSFPYANCYNWSGVEMEIRVLARPEEFDQNQAIALPLREYMRWDELQLEDALRMMSPEGSLLDANVSEERLPPPAESSSRPLTLLNTELDLSPPVGPRDPSPARHSSVPPSRTSSRSLSDSFESRSYVSGESDLGSVDGIMVMDIFSGTNADLDLLPLCELWLDMAPQLKQENIPNPTGLFAERDEIVRIIQDARVRAYAAMHAAESPPSAREVHRRDADASVHSQSPVERKRRYFRPRKVWRKLHARVRSLGLASSRL